MTRLRQFTGAIPFFIAIFLNAFVDLGHKIIVQNTVYKLYDGPQQVILTAVVNSLILLPFILLMSPAGFISDRFSKTRVMRFSAVFALVLTVLITVFYYLGWFWAAFTMTFLLAVQSAIYSPAKLGLLKAMFGKERLGEANGVASALAIIAILAGIFAFSILFEVFYSQHSVLATEAEILRAIAPVGFLLVLNAAVQVAMCYRIPDRHVEGSVGPFPVRRFVSGRLFKDDLQPLARNRAIRLSVIGLAVFWSVGQVMLAAFPSFFKDLTGNDNTIVVQGILACSGIGIALGAMVAGRYSRNYIETGLLPLGAIGIAIGLALLPGLETALACMLAFLFIGFSGGVFIVPLNALIQYYAEEHELGKTLAANNWVQNVTMFSFLVLSVCFAWFGWSSKMLLQLIAVVAMVGCLYVVYQLPQSFMRFVFSYILSRRYRVAVQGMKNIPAQGGVLMLGNHVSWIDWAVVQIASPRPIRFVMIRTIYERWYLRWFFDLFGCIPIDSGPRSRKALDTVAGYLNNGDVVCLFPEGAISRTGHLGDFRRGYERACGQVNEGVVILPFYIRGLWGSQFSRSSNRLKARSATRLKRDIIVAFGRPLPKETKTDVLKRRVFDLSIHSWQEYASELPTLSRVWIESARKMGSRPAIIDTTVDRTLSGRRALTGSIVLAQRVRSLKSQNIGVLLPTGAGGALMNMAILLAGKTIVNLNYTAGVDTLKNAVAQAGIDTIFTSERFLDRLRRKGINLERLFEDAELVDLEDFGKRISNMERLATLIAVTVLPAVFLKKHFCHCAEPTDTAAILFSSGSEGEPKGVQLSHRNILANVKQIADVLNMEDDDAMLANLPLFHAFGLTVNQFLPLLEGCPMICQADPTDVVNGARAIARHRATIMCGTSTFLRLYCRNSKVHPLMLDSLRVVVSGAEKLSDEVNSAFKLKFNKPLYEGYGATETTPVASVNMPDRIETQTFQVQRGHKYGSVGMPLPGTSCMIVDPSTFQELPTGEEGMILIGGVQVMQGYLNNPEKTDAVIRVINDTRWYVTGDKGYLDEDGYLFIVDRYSRFAKIAGEMVSLGVVEAAISRALNNPEIEVVVTSLPDAKKGEKLVALSEVSLPVDRLKQSLQQEGLPPLAIPAEWVQVPVLPKLGSGKTDFGQARAMAASALAATE